MQAWLAANRERKQAMDRAYAAANREAARQRASEWYRQNKSRPEVKAARAAYREATKEKQHLWNKRWRDDHPEECGVHARNRRARKRATGKHSVADLREIGVLQKGKCAYCTTRLTADNRHVDHITPLVRGGTNGRANLQLLCQPCNNRKHAKDPLDFAREIGRLI